MDKKVYVCKVTKDEELLVCDIVGAEFAEEALQESVRRHRVKLERSKAAASFGTPQKLTNNEASFKNGCTLFTAELLANALKKLTSENVPALRAEMSALSQAMARFERSLKRA